MVGTIDHLRGQLDDNLELYEMTKAESDFDSLTAIEGDAQALREIVEKLEFRRMFSNPADPLNCFVDIQAGAGGTEACDWAQMLLRQYLRYCERKGFRADVLEESEGDVAGIKSATLKIEGDYAFGHLRTETGVHRLVRKSPFDSSGGRHTSFASVFVYPEVDDSIEIEINPADAARLVADHLAQHFRRFADRAHGLDHAQHGGNDADRGQAVRHGLEGFLGLHFLVVVLVVWRIVRSALVYRLLRFATTVAKLLKLVLRQSIIKNIKILK